MNTIVLRRKKVMDFFLNVLNLLKILFWVGRREDIPILVYFSHEESTLLLPIVLAFEL